jgi:hypothetical protein
VWLFMTEKMLKKQFTYRFLCANITYINKKRKRVRERQIEKLIGDAHYGTLNDLKNMTYKSKLC